MTVWTLYAFTAVTLSTWPRKGNTCQEIIPDIDYENTKLTIAGCNIVSISKCIKTQQFQIPRKTAPFIGILIIHFLGSLYRTSFFSQDKIYIFPELTSLFHSPILKFHLMSKHLKFWIPVKKYTIQKHLRQMHRISDDDAKQWARTTQFLLSNFFCEHPIYKCLALSTFQNHFLFLFLILFSKYT